MNKKNILRILATILLLTACSVIGSPNEMTLWRYMQNQREELLAESVNSKLKGSMTAQEVGLVIVDVLYPDSVLISDYEIDKILNDLPADIDRYRRPEKVKLNLPIDKEDAMRWYSFTNDLVVIHVSKHDNWHFLNFDGNRKEERKYYDSYKISIIHVRDSGLSEITSSDDMMDTLIIVDYESVENAAHIRSILSDESSGKLDKESKLSLSPMSVVNVTSRFGFYYNSNGYRSVFDGFNEIYTFYRVLESGFDFSKVH